MCADTRVTGPALLLRARYETVDQANEAVGANGRPHEALGGYMIGVKRCSEAVRLVALAGRGGGWWNRRPSRAGRVGEQDVMASGHHTVTPHNGHHRLTKAARSNALCVSCSMSPLLLPPSLTIPTHLRVAVPVTPHAAGPAPTWTPRASSSHAGAGRTCARACASTCSSRSGNGLTTFSRALSCHFSAGAAVSGQLAIAVRHVCRSGMCMKRRRCLSQTVWCADNVRWFGHSALCSFFLLLMPTGGPLTPAGGGAWPGPVAAASRLGVGTTPDTVTPCVSCDIRTARLR